MIPETRYVRTTDGVHIAYQVVGDGPYDLMYEAGWLSNIDAHWDLPDKGGFLRRLAERARLIVFDRRGSGVSDRPASVDAISLEKGADDTLAVMDAVGSERAVFFGFEDGASVSLLVAAAHPERVLGLALFAPTVRGHWAPDYPWGWTDAEEAEAADLETVWGTEAFARDNIEGLVPESLVDDTWLHQVTRYWRLCASPAAARAIDDMLRDVDVRSILPAVRVPTLVMHRVGDIRMYQGGRWIADQIPGASFVALPGAIHPPFMGDVDRVLDELDRFVAGIRDEEAALDRVLTTIMFTDVVGSTDHAARIGDRAWSELLERHHQVVRALLVRHRGIEVDTTGDGFLARFDGSARAVRCALAIVDAVRGIGIETRVGCHAGEVELVAGNIRGLAVHVGARVAALAGPSEVLVSSTVRDLVAGSGLAFEDRGSHALKGVPDEWRLFRAVPIT